MKKKNIFMVVIASVFVVSLAKVRSMGIKGTKKLTQYLNKQVFKINLANITVSNIKSLIKSVIQNALNSVWGSKAKLIT